MSYVRRKVVRGTPYLYVVRTQRVGGKVVQKFVAYLGREDDLAVQAEAAKRGWTGGRK